MPPEPNDRPDDIERLFAADEATIRDAGFSDTVMREAAKTRSWRGPVLGAAGMAGFGFAAGGIVQLAPHLPDFGGWMDRAATSVSTANVAAAWQSAGNGVQLAIIAVLAGVTFLISAAAVQSR